MSKFLARHGWGLAALALTALYAAALVSYWLPTVTGSDQCSMYRAGRLIAEDGAFHNANFMDMEYAGEFWVINSPEKNQIYSTYPPGLALLLAAAEQLGGPGAEMWVAPVCAVLCVLLAYVLGRCFLPGRHAFLATFIVATCPVLFLNAELRNTHALGLFLTLAGMLAAVGPTRRWRGAASCLGAGLAGLLLGYNVAVRYTEGLLLIVPLAYWFTAHAYRPGRRAAGRRWVLAGVYLLAAAVPLALLALYHWYAFGAPWVTGYSKFNATTGGFAFMYLFANLWVYVPGLVNHALGPAFALALLVVLCARRGREASSWFWLAWVAPLFLLYHFYFWVSPDAYHLTMRFWLNVLPGVVYWGVLAARAFARRVGWPRRAWLAIAVAFAAAQGLWGVAATTPVAESLYRTSARHGRVVEFAEATIPPGSIIVFAELGPDPNKRVCQPETLAARNRWHLFSTVVLDFAKLQKDVAEETRRQTMGRAGTYQEDRTRNIFSRSATAMTAELDASWRAAAAKGARFFFLGTDADYAECQKTLARRFVCGEPVRGANVVEDWRWFPIKQRNLNDEFLRVRERPRLLAVPLELK